MEYGLTRMEEWEWDLTRMEEWKYRLQEWNYTNSPYNKYRHTSLHTVLQSIHMYIYLMEECVCKNRFT